MLAGIISIPRISKYCYTYPNSFLGRAHYWLIDRWFPRSGDEKSEYREAGSQDSRNTDAPFKYGVSVKRTTEIELKHGIISFPERPEVIWGMLYLAFFFGLLIITTIDLPVDKTNYLDSGINIITGLVVELILLYLISFISTGLLARRVFVVKSNYVYLRRGTLGLSTTDDICKAENFSLFIEDRDEWYLFIPGKVRHIVQIQSNAKKKTIFFYPIILEKWLTAVDIEEYVRNLNVLVRRTL